MASTYEMALARLNVNAQQDRRTDSRSYVSSQANSYTYAPIYAFDSSVMGNTARSNASAETDAKYSDEQGFTGKNAQTVAIALGLAVVGAGAVYVLTKI